MGKQLHFVHAEDDVQKLLAFLEKNHGKFVINSILYSPLQMTEHIVREMGLSRRGQYSIVFVPDDSFRNTAKYGEIVDGTAIEIMNCRKWKEEPSIYYDIGRFYIARKNDGTYDAHTLSLYNKMCSYIKKNYRYKKEIRTYLSDVVYEQIENGHINLSQLGHPLIWHSSN